MSHGGGDGRNGVVVGPALQPREHRRVNLRLVVVVHRITALVRLLRIKQAHPSFKLMLTSYTNLTFEYSHCSACTVPVPTSTSTGT